MTRDRFSRFEDRLQHLIEGGFARLFAGHLHPREVAIRLVHAMEDHALEQDGLHIAPDVYIVRLNPADHSAILSDHPDIAVELAVELVEMARAAGFALPHIPEVRLLADAQVASHQIALSAHHNRPRLESTEAMPRVVGTDEPASVEAPKAMLIVDGGQEVPLDKPVINVGRGRQNNIVIDDLRVSRHHAQIRLRFGRYVLFDLGSTAGTTVNNQPVREAVLQSGDVIGLAGHSLIYVEEEIPTSPSKHTSSDSDTRPSIPPQN